MARRPIYYDLETTGLKSDDDRIIEIAAYDAARNESFCSFVNPERPVGEIATKLCGITDEMVKDAPLFKEVAEKFTQFCSGDVVLIAHNGDNFDKHFLRAEYQRAKEILPNFAYIDTLKWARKYRPDLPKFSLQYLRELFQIPANNAHRALDDVMIMKQVFENLIGNLSMEEVYALLHQKRGPITQMPFGKHRGTPLQKVPKHYLKWLHSSGALDKEDNKELKMTLEKLSLV